MNIKVRIRCIRFWFWKEKKTKKLMDKLDSMKLQFKLMNEKVVTDYTLKQAITELSEMRDLLSEIAEKYDYSNLPQNI